jgi:hypothetical protein
VTLDPLYCELVSPAREFPEYRKLWAAVVILAVCDYLNARPGSRRQSDASEWIFGPDQVGPTSFENLCDVLELCPDRLRQQLRDHPPVGAQFSRHVQRTAAGS